MTNEFKDLSDFREIILKKNPIIDVRAPVEFALGHIPGSINLPLLNNEERHEVGTTYKEKGQDAAIALGYQLISGSIKRERISAWTSFIQKHSDAIVTCFRGGLRSKISQAWITEASFDLPRIKGGYKAFRQFLLYELQRLSEQPLLVVSGSTGAGKTLLIKEIKNVLPSINLEFLAKHRGSAFGAYSERQPSQGQFENDLVAELLTQENKKIQSPLLIEDESRMIGKCVLPEKLFLKLRESEIVLLEEKIEDRVQIIFEDYISKLMKDGRSQDFLNYPKALQIIAKKLGGQRSQEVSEDLARAIKETRELGHLEGHKIWIEKLLVWYYDPFYVESLKRRNPRIVFRGTRKEVLDFITNKK